MSVRENIKRKFEELALEGEKNYSKRRTLARKLSEKELAEIRIRVLNRHMEWIKDGCKDEPNQCPRCGEVIK